MDFKPYEKVVLAKVADVDSAQADRPAKKTLPEPREFTCPGELVLITADPPAESAPDITTHVLEAGEPTAETAATPRAAAANQGTAADAADTAGVEDAAAAATAEPPHKDYIFAYDGDFVGHYRSSRRITTRTVFRTVAQRLYEKMGHLDPHRIELFKLVAVKVDPGTLEESSDDTFRWFDGGIPSVPE